ncbi:MAG: DUF6585 family protein [Phototrophicaceae bacterium]
MTEIIHSKNDMSIDLAIGQSMPDRAAVPTLGAFEARYPANRVRLLLHGVLAMAVAWGVVTLLLWDVEREQASVMTVLLLAAMALVVGWTLLHFWNREVLIYEHGFTYRLGSGVIRVPFSEVVSLRGRGVRRSYLSGLVERTSYRFTVRTNQNTQIVLGDMYARIEQMSLHLEHGINQVMRPRVERQLESGVRVPFSDELMISDSGLHVHGQLLPWSDLSSFCIHNGMLLFIIEDSPEFSVWYRTPLAQVDNLRLLVDLLLERQPQQAACEEFPA